MFFRNIQPPGSASQPHRRVRSLGPARAPGHHYAVVSSCVQQRRAGVRSQVLDGRHGRVIVVVVIIIIISSSSSLLSHSLSAPPSLPPRFFALGQAGKYANAPITLSHFVTFPISGQQSFPETKPPVRARVHHSQITRQPHAFFFFFCFAGTCTAATVSFRSRQAPTRLTSYIQFDFLTFNSILNLIS